MRGANNVYTVLHSAPSRNWFSMLVPERRDVVFAAFWLFVVFVSVVDCLLIVVYRDTIALLERNPVGSTLLEWANGHIGPFVLAKLTGTLLVGTLLLLLYWRKPRWGLPVAAALASFQLWLLWFLFCA